MLVRYAKKLYGYLYKTRQHICWYLQYRRECNENTVITTSSKSYRFERILIIVPHADDELIGCYQFMKSTKAEVCLFYCDLTGSNNDKTNRYIRQKEFERFCCHNGFKYVISSGIIHQFLQRVIEKYDPNTIMLPSIVDWHPQHREVNNITSIVLCNMNIKPKIIWYQVTVPIDYKWANYYIPMNKQQQNQKWEMFSHVYRSQKKMPLIRFKYNERIAGKKYGEYAVEVFCTMLYEEWARYMSVSITIPVGEFMGLKFFIKSLTQVKREAARLYGRMNL